MISRVSALLLPLALAIARPAAVGAQQTMDQRIALLETQVAELRVRLGLKTGPPSNLPIELAGNDNARWGFPGGHCTLLVKEFYVICYDQTRRVPEYVTYHLTRAELTGGTEERTDDFRPDPELAPGDRAELADYRNSGYDRGHMAPAADFKRSREAMSASFLLSNMAPQRPNLNRGIWARLEDQVRVLAQSHGNVWIFTGALYLDAAASHAAPPADTIGPDLVAVPSHFFKVVLCEHATGTHELFAFILPNQLNPISGSLESFLVSVDRIEALTGLDLFAELPDAEENRLEAAKATAWPVP